MLQGHAGFINIIILISITCGSATILAMVVKPANALQT